MQRRGRRAAAAATRHCCCCRCFGGKSGVPTTRPHSPHPYPFQPSPYHFPKVKFHPTPLAPQGSPGAPPSRALGHRWWGVKAGRGVPPAQGGEGVGGWQFGEGGEQGLEEGTLDKAAAP